MTEAEIMTRQEALAVAALYKRERDAMIGETEFERTLRVLRQANETLGALLAKQTMQRPGIQNGLKKLGELEGEGNSLPIGASGVR